jgi:hypothetical protein
VPRNIEMSTTRRQTLACHPRRQEPLKRNLRLEQLDSGFDRLRIAHCSSVCRMVIHPNARWSRQRVLTDPSPTSRATEGVISIPPPSLGRIVRRNVPSPQPIEKAFLRAVGHLPDNPPAASTVLGVKP